ncbi:MAG: tRNA nucleotidyltransferase [Clostridia bacterium]|nr:tRNA nucleotidyltransferase [Clostridia bacterium]
MDEWKLTMEIAARVEAAGGRAYLVGGFVRDRLLGKSSKDLDIEVHGITPAALRGILSELGEVFEKGVSFGVLGLRHTDIDIAMPRRERRSGVKHTDFDVTVDPFLPIPEASRRRDFTINAMLFDPLTEEIIDPWGGRSDLQKKIIRHVSDGTFGDDALRVFRAAQFAARLDAEIAPETVGICKTMQVGFLARERVFEELCKALLKADRPSVFFRTLRDMEQLDAFFPEIKALIGVEQNPVYHPEGDVFEHTMQVLDAAAGLRNQAEYPLEFMLSAMVHDLGKIVASRIKDGRIVSYEHEIAGIPLAKTQLLRLTGSNRILSYCENMVRLHMRPHILASANSAPRKTRQMFDESICPADLILLSQADNAGKEESIREASRQFLCQRLADYRTCMENPMLTGADLLKAGYAAGAGMKTVLARAKQLHFAGLEKKQALRQLLAEYPPEKTKK